MAREKVISDISSLVTGAYELIDEGGYANFSTRKLADRMGISHMTLYNYTNREEVLKQVVEKGFALFHKDYLPPALTLLEETKSSALFFRILADQLYLFALKNTNLYRFMFQDPASSLTRDPRISRLYTSGVDALSRIISEDKIEALRRDAYLFFVLINGLIIAHLDRRHNTTEEDCLTLMRRAWELILSP